jgi:hypothetical protein
MTDARVDTVYADRHGAREFLAQADRFLADAAIDGLSAESQSVLLHNATISACDAILQAVGLRVTPGDRSHALRLETALERLPQDTEELFESLDASRERRTKPPMRQVSSSRRASTTLGESVIELLELSRAFVS